jgi:hypothetical protein
MTRKQSDRRISIRSIRKNPPDLHKLGRALIALAMAQAEAEAQVQAEDAKTDRKTAKGEDAHAEDES